jgi:hypothetical protein
MSNRNFDNRVIIQRLQQQNYARNLYKNNTTGQAIINNPQNSDGTSSSVFIIYVFIICIHYPSFKKFSNDI